MLGDVSQELIDECIRHIGTPESQEYIQAKILDPIICYILGRLQPYIMATAALFVTVIILLIVVTVIVLRK